ncbi:unnamed protein product [Anisakis simplex]|uniref:Epimerase domain-containing protein n=1 Tax=Anisakis simplex TaxID=6269 RepID=A0A0M3K9T7_ANISI|nr:unnamed protein product [Anisakis simplex]
MKKSLVQIGSAVCRIKAAPLSATNLIQQQRNLAGSHPDPMMRYKKLADTVTKKPRVLITGSLGQLGRGLAKAFRYMYGRDSVLMTDIVKPPQDGSVAALNIRKYKLQVFIPSTIGAFGPTSPLKLTPDICVQRPRTIYGVTKVYAELLGEYYNDRFGLDFRCLRYPGIISATMPGGGTTDYAVQAFYDALRYGKHKCYLKPDARLPMMYDTDCTGSTVFYLSTPEEKLKQRTYNVTGFSLTPEELTAAIRKVMPNFEIEYEICPIRQKIAESWPDKFDDSNAKKDWGWAPEYDLDATVKIMFELVGKQLEEQKHNTTSPKSAVA